MKAENSLYCECLPDCLFFNDKMVDIQLITDIMKTRYCKGEHWECARFIIFKARGKESVPANLYPHETYRAYSIIKEKE